MTTTINGRLTNSAQVLDGLDANLSPRGPGQDQYVITYDDGTGTLILTPGGGMANPMTNEGDIIVGGAVGAPGRLGIGAAGTAPVSNGTTLVYTVVGTPSDTMPTTVGATTPGVGAAYSRFDHSHDYPATSLGTTHLAGTSGTAYVDVADTPPVAPAFGPGQSVVMLFLPIAEPGGAQVLAGHGDGGATRGWVVRCGANAGARGEMDFACFGLNGSAVVPLVGADFTGATFVPHVLALTVLGDQTVRYSWDGGAVIDLAALSGTYAPPLGGDPMRLGLFVGGGDVATSVQPVAMRWYSTVLSDADLVAVAADRASYFLTNPSAGTLICAFDARDTRGVETYLDAVNVGIRWRVVGALQRQGR